MRLRLIYWRWRFAVLKSNLTLKSSTTMSLLLSSKHIAKGVYVIGGASWLLMEMWWRSRRKCLRCHILCRSFVELFSGPAWRLPRQSWGLFWEVIMQQRFIRAVRMAPKAGRFQPYSFLKINSPQFGKDSSDSDIETPIDSGNEIYSWSETKDRQAVPFSNRPTSELRTDVENPADKA